MSPSDPREDPCACPPWCTGEHEATSDLRLVHRSEGVIVPGVERLVNAHGGIDAPTIVEIAIGLERTCGETWVWIGPDHPSRSSAILSVGTARRLIRATEALLRWFP
ncbi:MAG: hypothetical protein PIR02_14935 [Microbacterium enclense]